MSSTRNHHVVFIDVDIHVVALVVCVGDSVDVGIDFEVEIVADHSIVDNILVVGGVHWDMRRHNHNGWHILDLNEFLVEQESLLAIWSPSLSVDAVEGEGVVGNKQELGGTVKEMSTAGCKDSLSEVNMLLWGPVIHPNVDNLSLTRADVT